MNVAGIELAWQNMLAKGQPIALSGAAGLSGAPSTADQEAMAIAEVGSIADGRYCKAESSGTGFSGPLSSASSSSPSALSSHEIASKQLPMYFPNDQGFIGLPSLPHDHSTSSNQAATASSG